jgi:hypothetical protein
MEKRGIGLTEKSNLNQQPTPSLPMFGYTDKKTVKIDFDDTCFKAVKYWANRILKWFRLSGFIILRSSKDHYHVVFDRAVTWEKNLHIVAWIALESKNPKVQNYLVMQCIKESSTLRISRKGEKPSPRIVFRYGTQTREINNFLVMRKFVKRIIPFFHHP